MDKRTQNWQSNEVDEEGKRRMEIIRWDVDKMQVDVTKIFVKQYREVMSNSLKQFVSLNYWKYFC